LLLFNCVWLSSDCRANGGVAQMIRFLVIQNASEIPTEANEGNEEEFSRLTNFLSGRVLKILVCRRRREESLIQAFCPQAKPGNFKASLRRPLQGLKDFQNTLSRPLVQAGSRASSFLVSSCAPLMTAYPLEDG
jgi:hypothetical protein